MRIAVPIYHRVGSDVKSKVPDLVTALIPSDTDLSIPGCQRYLHGKRYLDASTERPMSQGQLRSPISITSIIDSKKDSLVMNSPQNVPHSLTKPEWLLM